MQFNSISFLVFFAVVLGLHRLPIPWTAKKVNLMLASYVFYMAWNPPFVLLLWLSTGVDWVVARRIHAAESQRQRRFFLIVSLSINLGVLAAFKYGNFLLENFAVLTRLLGVEFQPAPLDIVLPVGISFYTFQTLSYTIDIYLRRARPWDSFVDYALYVTFFPQLVAGPIVRASHFLPQCREACQASGRDLGLGLTLLLLGLFMKSVLADGMLAPVSETVFNLHHAMGFGTAWVGALAFSGQIFCDFAGYSTCAIGVAMCLGFSIPENFRFPYAAVGFSDFWRRWHISLSSWLRDYLYIPLGGNRMGLGRTQVNLMLTMLIGGLWHGAAWTFVVWGALHGFYLLAERGLRAVVPSGPVWRSRPVLACRALVTFFFVCIAWVFFRCDDFTSGVEMTSAMLGLASSTQGLEVARNAAAAAVAVVVGICLLHFAMREVDMLALIERSPWWVRSVVLAGMIVSIASVDSDDRAFIYFQF